MRWIPLLLALFVLSGCGSDASDDSQSVSQDVGAEDAGSLTETPQTAKTGQAVKDRGGDKRPVADGQPTGDAAAASQDADTSGQLVAQAEVHIRRGLPGPAIESLSQAIGVDPDNSRAYALRAGVYVALGENANALADFSAAIRLNPQNAKLYNARGFFFMARQQLDRAEADFNQAIRLDAQFKQGLNNRGLVKLARGEFEAAVTDFDLALAVDREYLDARNNRGYAKLRLGQHDAAIADFDKAISADKSYHNAHNNRGLAHYQKEDYAAAVDDFTRAIELQRFDSKYYRHRREALIKLDRTQEALQDAEQLVWLQNLITLNKKVVRAPRDVSLYLDRAAFYFKANETEMAIKDLNLAQRLSPGNPVVLTRRAIVWAAMEMYRNAVNDSSESIRIQPSQQAFSIRGDAYLELGETRKAIDDYEKAKRIDATVAEAYLRHSKDLEQQGDQDAAQKALQQAYLFDPTLKQQ